jgi:hypothetical protein
MKQTVSPEMPSVFHGSHPEQTEETPFPSKNLWAMFSPMTRPFISARAGWCGQPEALLLVLTDRGSTWHSLDFAGVYLGQSGSEGRPKGAYKVQNTTELSANFSFSYSSLSPNSLYPNDLKRKQGFSLFPPLKFDQHSTNSSIKRVTKSSWQTQGSLCNLNNNNAPYNME